MSRDMTDESGRTEAPKTGAGSGTGAAGGTGSGRTGQPDTALPSDQGRPDVTDESGRTEAPKTGGGSRSNA